MHISVGPDKPCHMLFFHFKQNSLFGAPFFLHIGTTLLNVHAVSIDPDAPPLLELGLHLPKQVEETHEPSCCKYRYINRENLFLNH